MPNEYGSTPTPETGTRATRQHTRQPTQKEPGFNTDGAADYAVAVKAMTMSLNMSKRSIHSMTATDGQAGISLHTICEMDDGMEVQASTNMHAEGVAITVQDSNKISSGSKTQLAATSSATERTREAEREEVERDARPA